MWVCVLVSGRGAGVRVCWCLWVVILHFSSMFSLFLLLLLLLFLVFYYILLCMLHVVAVMYGPL